VKQCAEIVHEKAQLRRLVHVCETEENTALADDQPVSVCLGRLQDALLGIEAATHKQSVFHVAQVTDEVFAGIERLRDRHAELVGLTTGIESLDLATTGIREGEFWILGGRTGEGKSSVGVKALLDNARSEVPVAVFSPEMRRDQILTRMWSQHGDISFDKLRNPARLTNAEYQQLQRVMVEVGKLPIYIDDSSSLSIREIVARARLLVKRQHVQLIVVDYLQLVDAEGRDERQRVSTISNALRELAKEGCLCWHSPS
jgi:replicative DNA helicase